MPAPPPAPSSPASPTPEDPLLAWRVVLIRRVVWIGAVAALVPSLLMAADALRGGPWAPVAACWTATVLALWLGHAGRLPHLWRASGATGLLYAFACWSLVRGSSVATMYLLACPVMVVLALGTRPALAVLALCCATLVGLGGWLGLPFPISTGLPGHSALRWGVIGGNLLMLGLLLTLSCAFLLRQLQQALQRQAEGAEALRRSEQLLREVASQVPGMVFRLRIGAPGLSRFLFVSPGARDMLGLEPEALMHDAARLYQRLNPDDVPALRTMVERLRQGRSHGELQLCLGSDDGASRWALVQWREVERDDDGVVVNGLMTDISARKAAEALAWRQANFDSLTGLPNRLMLHGELTRALAAARRDGRALALLLIDLDRFKEVNDTLGHACGDELLTQAGRRLQRCLRPGDTVARMGGDEFVVLLPAVDDAGEIDRTGQRVLAAMTDAFVLPAETTYVSASIGAVAFPHDGDTPEDLLKHADQAMYQAKDAGRNRLCRFTPAMQARAQQALRLGNDLRSAIAQGQLSLAYQPIVNLRDGGVRKAEALLRWQHPELGAIAPAQFIPIAEATGQIGALGDWVFEAAARQVREWRRAIDPGFQVSINWSPLQFRARPDGMPWLQHLAALELPGEALEVEITEGLLLDSGDAVLQQLRAMRQAGMRLALDDFGTGYSALAYLHRFELDRLKIDRSFVSGEAAGPTGRSLCRAMVRMAHELNLEVVAEGVETAEQHAWLLGIGCDQAQGWLFGRPMAPPAFEHAVGAGAMHRPAPQPAGRAAAG